MSVEGIDGKSLTREEKDRLVEEARNSGQAQREWCASQGIRLRTLRSWICDKNRREKRSGLASEPVAWLEVRRSRTSQTQAFRSCAVEVCVGTYVVRVSSGFDRTLLADVCRTLSGLC